ncbi:MAG: pyridoxamine 5'-phosphate oxidase family protein [Candidatus Dormibacteria bacterium]
MIASQPEANAATLVRRHPERGRYDRQTIDAILDEGLICHLGIVSKGRPWVLPTMYARRGDQVYIHGSPGARMLRTAAASAQVCLTVSLLDGLVLARSAFNHSMNYRSVVVSGRARRVTTSEEKMVAFRALVDQVLPGRWGEARIPSLKELRATTVLALDLAQASAKVRTGPPLDAATDIGLPVWAGVIPLGLRAEEPIAAPDLAGDPTPPGYARDYRR